MKKITIEDPFIVPRTKFKGFVIVFPYSIEIKHPEFLKDQNLNYQMVIGIGDYLLITWDVKIWENNLKVNDIIKLAFPFAIQRIKEKLEDNTLFEYEEYYLTTDNTHEYPFDTKKIKKIKDYSFEFHEVEMKKRSQPEINKIADYIITTRDNINTLSNSRFKKRMHQLNQERFILDLFRSVDIEEEFTHRLSSLANLIGDLNIEFLRNETNQISSDKGSIDLLEIFFKLHKCDLQKISELISIYRNIRKIRQAYPIHTDTVKGLVKSFKYFKIDYPIQDFNNAWINLIKAYKIAVEIELELFKNMNTN